MGVATCSVFFILFFFLFLLVILSNPAESKCPEYFWCGKLGKLGFPFSNYTDPDCGLLQVDCTQAPPKLQSWLPGVWYEIHEKHSNKLRLWDPVLHELLQAKSCSVFLNRTRSPSHFISFTTSPNLTIFSCFSALSNSTRTHEIEDRFKDYKDYKCNVSTFYYKTPPQGEDTRIPDGCWMVQMPVKPASTGLDELFQMLTPEFEIEYHISEDCLSCHDRGRKCLSNANNELRREEKNLKTHIIAIAVPVSAVFVGICLIVSIILYRCKKRNNNSYLLSRNISSDPSSKSDIEVGSFYFGAPIFSYEELVKATNNFDPSQELGDGGFGTVYYGKLQDGREVAIKRLYEHNCRRVEQFSNEIKILTCLRHPNLVSLYGCTSRRSRELLLVYEYISNGTVADHLHGERAKEAPLTWLVRISIAIETANALAYLHKSDIIHRDVKTNNILLDSSFCVKVADFGLSRLFPNDVTHVSTAPQGTPGYVDPEYHQCYQLTDKSDVYSFGVVLIELISSMPAVDISRHRHEINLANLAVNRIQQCAFDELIDPSLGYNSDTEVTRMTTSVAELAFRCLQVEKDLRPSMDEVLAFLMDIRDGGDCKFEKVDGVNGYYGVHGKRIPPSPETDDAVLLKNKNFQSSPVAVTDTWISSSSTTTSSIG